VISGSKVMTNSPLSPIRWLGRLISRVIRLILVLMLVAFAALGSFVAWQSTQPVGTLGANPQGPTADLHDLNYWQFMAGGLAASRETPASCHRNRLVGLAIMLPVYPALYTAFALFPDSALACQAQPSPLIPDPITWSQAPETWWWLVKEISWLVLTEPQLDFTPGVGQKVEVDRRCDISLDRMQEQ
jgi:hypothetical protein